MIKINIFKNISLLIKKNITYISNIFSILVTLLTTFILTKYLIVNVGKQLYSFYPLSNNVINYFNILIISFNALSFRFITVSLIKNDKQKSISYFVSSFFTNVMLSLFIFIIFIYFAFNFQTILNIPKDGYNEILKLFTILFITFIITTLTSQFGVYTYALNKFTIRAFIEIGANILKVLTCLILLKLNLFNVSSIAIANLSFILFQAICNYYFINKFMPDYKIKFKYFSLDSAIEVFKSSFFIGLNNLGVLLVTSLSLIISNVYIGLDASSDLSLVQLLVGVIAVILTTFSNIIYPMVTHFIHNKESLSKLYQIESIIMLIIVLPICIAIVYGFDFYTLWLGIENVKNLELIATLILVPYLFEALSRFYFASALSLNYVKRISFYSICCGVLNLCIMFVLLRFNFKLTSIMIANITSNFIFYIILIPIYIENKLQKLNIIYYKTFIKNIIFTIVSLSICFLFNAIMHNYTTFNLFTFIIFACINYIILVLINFRFLKRN